MSARIQPKTEDEAAEAVRTARADRAPLRLEGNGTRAGLGRPVQAARTLSTARLTDITLYEPAEMVISARAGTPVAEVEAALAAKGQMLAFEPPDFRRLYGTEGAPTIGAVAAGNLSGPRRIWAGACRDSLIGVRFVNGEGEVLRTGGRVMKNVTGLDLVKLQAGAWGTLGLLTEVTFKVVPQPENVATFALAGLDDARAVAAMSAALGSPYEITAAAHVAATGRTLLRIEGFDFSVAYREGELARLLAPFGRLARLPEAEGAAFWSDLRDGAVLAEPRERAIWRLSLKPSEAPAAVAAIRASRAVERAVEAVYDWGGGLVWLATDAAGDAGAAVIRAAAKAARGYATLVRAPDPVRVEVPVFEPEAPAIAALSARIKRALDPDGLFNPGRMHPGL